MRLIYKWLSAFSDHFHHLARSLHRFGVCTNNLEACVNMDQYVDFYLPRLMESSCLTTSHHVLFFNDLLFFVSQRLLFFPPKFIPDMGCTRKLVNGLIETRSLNVSELQFNAVVKNRILCERTGSAVFYIWQEWSHNIFLLCYGHF